MKKYIDISYWQQDINYKKVALNDVEGVLIRCGYTSSDSNHKQIKDSMFETHYRGFTKEKIPVGVYWYSLAITPTEARKEAQMVLRIIKNKKIELPIAWDTEDQYRQARISKEQLTKCAITFCKTIEEAGYYVMIYASSSWFRNNLQLESIKAYDKWIAAWGKKRPDLNHGIWQYTSKGKINGIRGYVDINNVYKDYKQIIFSAELNNLKQDKSV